MCALGAPSIAVIDYHKGNLSSVARGLARAGATPLVTDDPAAMRAADALVLPGVGSFYDAITSMAARGQDAAVLDAVARGVPFLGICLGQQLLFACGDEGVRQGAQEEAGTAPVLTTQDAHGSGLAPGAVFEAAGRRWVRGLGLLEGACTALPAGRLKIPHVGWDQIHLTPGAAACLLLRGVADSANVYFTHSFAVEGEDAADVAAHTFYARAFPAVIWHGNLFGCQFHPEKSSAHGQLILQNFVEIARGRDRSGA